MTQRRAGLTEVESDGWFSIQSIYFPETIWMHCSGSGFHIFQLEMSLSYMSRQNVDLQITFITESILIICPDGARYVLNTKA